MGHARVRALRAVLRDPVHSCCSCSDEEDDGVSEDLDAALRSLQTLTTKAGAGDEVQGRF